MQRVLYIALTLLLLLSCGSSCNSHKSGEVPPCEELNLDLYAERECWPNTLRMSGTTWEVGDAIGIFAYRDGAEVSAETLYPKVCNQQWIAENAEGHFISAKGAVRIRKGEPLGLIAYYPYYERAELEKLEIPIDVSDQSDRGRIDLLYAKGSKVVTFEDSEAHLVFGRVMSRLVVTLESEDGGDLSRAMVRLEGLRTSGVLDLASGKVILGEETKPLTGHKMVERVSKVTFEFILPPGQSSKGAKLTFEVNGKSHYYSIGVAEARKLQAGRSYTFPFVVKNSGGVTQPDEENNVPKQAPYAEIPQTNVGVMQDAIYALVMVEDSYFGKAPEREGYGSRRNYSYAYSKKNFQPYWVAYPLYPDCFGNATRSKKWIPSPDIPLEFQPNLSSSYPGIYDRGHMLASSARTATQALNQTTFYYTNSIPQVARHNQGIWQEHENFEKMWGNKNDLDTLFVVTGPLFEKQPTRYTSDKEGVKHIPVPSHSWKVMLRYDRVEKKYFTLAVKIPNVDSRDRDWRPYVTTVKALEEELGVTFFNKLPPEVAEEVKSQKDLSHWQ